MTTREIQGHLHEMYGVEVSPGLISSALGKNDPVALD
jgi:transposase-like protein